MSADRAGYTAGLRALADALDADEFLPLPFDGTCTPLTVFVDTKAEVVAFARLLPHAAKKYDDTSSSYGFELLGLLHGLKLAVKAPREQVCTRRVTGTKTVTIEVPDPVALAAVPKVSVTTSVETAVWDCGSLLAPEAVSA
jgi:hypothetical protein